jgi:hypothetical protein
MNNEDKSPAGGVRIVEEIVLIEEVDIEVYAARGEKPPHAHRYRIRVDKEAFVVHVPSMMGRELLTLAKKTPVEQYALYERMHHGEVRRIALDECVYFTKHGVERFTTIPLDPTEGDG